MKPIRVLLSLVFVVAMLFASALSTSAIGFEAETAYESVFVVYSGNSLGSGFSVGENCIVTNAHVISDLRSITIMTYGGSEYKASVLGINEREDIAVLVVNDARFPFLTIADTSLMKTGDDIYAIGAPKGMAYTLTKGGISAKERVIGNQTYIQIDAAINEGNSGGPLLNDAGQVLGINTLKMFDSEGLGLSIPIGRVCDYLKSLGVKLDANGNVAMKVTMPQGMRPSDENSNQNSSEEKNDHPKDEHTPAVTSVAVIVAVMSLAGNVVLMVLLLESRKKCSALHYDPSERTDFDIDILE